MTDYLVTWAIDDFDAETPLEAARKALRTQRNEDSTAVVFTVSDGDRRWQVDLLTNEVTELRAKEN